MTSRFRFALENTRAADWQRFERLASTFLADEFGELRTLASPSGDEGRDAMLFQPTGDESVAMQYSVQVDWKSKVRKTARRLSEKHPQVTLLVFVTPLEIGADADETRRKLRQDFSLALDVRDRHCLVEREGRSESTRLETDRYCRAIVDPIVEERAVIDRTAAHLSTHESRAALLYLVLQRQDSDMRRHLTKLSFDALVKAALRGTDNDNRMSRTAIYESVRNVLPTHEDVSVTGYVDNALKRMDREIVRHWRKQDEFCLTHEARTKLQEGLAQLALMNSVFEHELRDNLRFVAEGMEVDISIVDHEPLIQRLRRVMERFLFDRGEAFADSVRTGQQCCSSLTRSRR